MVNKKQKNNAVNLYVLALAFFIPVFLLLEFVAILTPLTSGIAFFPLKAAQCGDIPHIGNRFAAAYTYTKPGDIEFHGPTIFTGSQDLFCTAEEAEAAGYHLRADSSPCNPSLTTCTNGYGASIMLLVCLAIISGIASYVLAWLVYRNAKLRKE